MSSKHVIEGTKTTWQKKIWLENILPYSLCNNFFLQRKIILHKYFQNCTCNFWEKLDINFTIWHSVTRFNPWLFIMLVKSKVTFRRHLRLRDRWHSFCLMSEESSSYPLDKKWSFSSSIYQVFKFFILCSNLSINTITSKKPCRGNFAYFAQKSLQKQPPEVFYKIRSF